MRLDDFNVSSIKTAINGRFLWPLSFKIIDIYEGSKIRATICLILVGSWVFTSESLSLFRCIVSKFHFHVNSSN